MTITPNSWAAGIGVAADNKQFAVQVDVLERKHLLIGSYDPSILTIEDNVPVRITSAADAADKFGQGFMLHRMALAAEKGSYFNIETWALPNPESGTAVQATGTVVIGGGPATSAGKLVIYIGGEKVSVNVAVGDVVADIGAALIAAVTADPDLPVTATGAATVTLEAKSGGTWGNYIPVTMGWNGEELPGAITVTITQIGDVIAGANDPDIDDALEGLGTGDSANWQHFTDLNVGYGIDDDDVIDAIDTYNGLGNEQTGLYSPLVGRPFRCLYGDVVPKDGVEDGLADLVTLADKHRTGRACGVIPAPGSPNAPCEIACQTMGVLARLNAVRAEQSALNVVLSGVIPGLRTDDWTAEYDNRDYAVKNGVGTTMEKGGVVTIQNVLTFYRPASVAIASNGYRSMRNISIVQNMLNAVRVNFEREKWSGCSIVVDVAKVGNVGDREKARDIGSVVDDLLAIVEAFGNRAWIYSAAWTKELLAAGGLVSIRTGANGFDCTLPVLLSGEAGIFNTVIEFDTSLAVLL
jgi:phage tail sheath gpL-like